MGRYHGRRWNRRIRSRRRRKDLRSRENLRDRENLRSRENRRRWRAGTGIPRRTIRVEKAGEPSTRGFVSRRSRGWGRLFVRRLHCAEHSRKVSYGFSRRLHFLGRERRHIGWRVPVERSLENTRKLAGLGLVHDRWSDCLGSKIPGREIGANRVYQSAGIWCSWRGRRPCNNRIPIRGRGNRGRLK
jgi:hypothetical protein